MGAPGDEELARTYDRLEGKGRGTFWGLIEPTGGLDKYDLALLDAAELTQVPLIRIRYYNRVRKELEERVREYTPDDQIETVVLADNLRNQVELEGRRVAGKYDVAGLPRLYEYGEFLLDKARQESWVYDQAQRLADRLLEISGGTLEAWRFKQRLLRLRGDLAGELAMYESMPDSGALRAFKLQGRGELKAQLGLWEDAEIDLRGAESAAPQDPAPLAALATLLIERGRVAEAAVFARRGWDFRGSNADRDVQLHAAAVHLRALMAQGMLDEAGAVAADLPDGDPAHAALLRGSVAYARGDTEAAMGRFDTAAASTRGALGYRGALGRAAAALRRGEWQDAYEGFLTVADSDPLLRHRAFTGVALLHTLIGDPDRALTALEAALEAAPGDGYALYLRGHVLRARGDYAEALVALSACLEASDDMLHAVLEVVLCHEALALESPGQEAENLFRAMRYSDRLVELASRRGSDFRFSEVRGRVHYRAKELRTADQAFATAQQSAQDPAERLYAQAGRGLVLYAQGRVEDARDAFLALQDGLRRDDEYWQYADATLTAIDDHSQKVQLVDRFERESMGNIWASRGFRIVDGQVVLRNRLSSQPLVATRQDAAPVAGRFLGAEVTLELQQPAQGAVVGLRLLREQGGKTSLEAWLGLKDASPYLYIQDQNNDPEPIEGLQAMLPGFDATAAQRLGLFFAPDETSEGRTFVLVATWNGVVIHRHPLRGVSSNTGGELQVSIGGKGLGRAEAVATFDDFRVQRREK